MMLRIYCPDLNHEPLSTTCHVMVDGVGALILPASLLVPERQEPTPKAKTHWRQCTSLHVRVQGFGLRILRVVKTSAHVLSMLLNI